MHVFMVIRNRTKKLVFSVVFIILAFWMSITGFDSLAASVFGPLKQRVIVIDPGHGGIDGGANCPGFLEKDINLEIAKLIKAQLQARGAKVILTRDKDTNLDQYFAQTLSRHKKDLLTRIDIIKKHNPDLFLSIHVNSNPRRPKTSGPIVFYNRKIPQSRYLAETVQNYLNQTSAKNGFKKHLSNPGNFFLLNNAPCPGAIVEVGFMSNSKEKQMLQTKSYQKELALAICDSIQHYLNSVPNTNTNNHNTLMVNSTGSQQDIVLYYPKIDEDRLFPVRSSISQPVASGTTINNIFTVVEDLMAGPKNNQFEPVFSNKVKVLGVNVVDGIATINLSKEITSLTLGSNEEFLSLTALVETVCQFPDVNGVRILVDGKHTAILGQHLDVSTVLLPQQSKLRAAIVIDDLAGSNEGLKKMMDLKRPLTMAVMPKRNTTRETAELVHKRGYQIFLHLPMEPEVGKASWLGDGAIVSNMTPAEASAQVKNDLADIPYVIGMNNHMGSKITKRKDLMLEVLKIAKARNLIYLDSRTTEDTVIPELAKQLKMPILERSVFLDDINSIASIRKRMHKFADIVKQKGTAIAIGHVGVTGNNTAQVLTEMIPWLEEQGIEIVFASQLITGK